MATPYKYIDEMLDRLSTLEARLSQMENFLNNHFNYIFWTEDIKNPAVGQDSGQDESI